MIHSVRIRSDDPHGNPSGSETVTTYHNRKAPLFVPAEDVALEDLVPDDGGCNFAITVDTSDSPARIAKSCYSHIKKRMNSNLSR